MLKINNIVGGIATGTVVGAGVVVYMNRDKIKAAAKTAVFKMNVNNIAKGIKRLDKVRLSGKKVSKKDVAYATALIGRQYMTGDTEVLDAAIEKAADDGVDIDAVIEFAGKVYADMISHVAEAAAKDFAEEFGEGYEDDFDLEEIMKNAAEFAASLHNESAAEDVDEAEAK